MKRWAAAPHFAPARKPRQLWGTINRRRLMEATGHHMDLLDHFFEAGQLELHSVAAQARVIGTLILYFAPKEAGGNMVVYWCEMRPHRWEHDWLIEAAEYLKLLAQERGCPTIQVCIDLDRKDECWRHRLEKVGFRATLIQLELKP